LKYKITQNFSCEIDGDPTTDEEIEKINNNAKLLYNLFINNLY